MTNRQPPKGYDPPHEGVRTTYVQFYLKPQADHGGPTPLFTVMRLDAEGARPMAERCLVRDGIAIVDALRLDYGIATWGVG